MMFGKKCGLDPKKKAIEELLGYLDEKDGEELGEVVKPKSIEVTKIEKSAEPDEEMPEVEGMEKAEGVEGSESTKMSEEELAELIEAIQSKLGA